MNISFWLTSTTRHMTSENWGKAPMGGSEISAVHLGEKLLERGHDVTYFLQRCESFDNENLHVRRHDQIFDEQLEYFICVRPHPVLQGDFGDVKKILWSGDAFDQPSMDLFYDEKIVNSMDAFIFKSKWQEGKILEKYYKIKEEKVHILYNCYKPEFFGVDGISPNPKRFIHASTWYRGLKNFIDIWPEILKKIPDAEIHVFSKTALYSEYSNDKGYYDIAEELVELPGIILREPVPQRIMAQEMKKAWLMLYPNTGFVETSCAVALQSIVSGTPVIATKRAGLIETIGGAGVLIDNKEENWQKKFVKTAVEMDSKKRRILVDSGSQRQALQTWKNQVERWEGLLKSL